MEKDVVNEIDEMLKGINNDGSEEVKEEEEVIDKKEEEVKEVDKKEEDVEIKEEIEIKKEEEVDKKEEVEIDKKEEVDERDKTIESLRKENEELKKAKVETKVEPKEEPKPTTLEEQDFIGELDPEEIIRDKNSLNKLLNSVYMKGVADAEKVTSEKILLHIPDIVKYNIGIMNDLKETSENFYKENPDLKPFSKVVAAVFEELMSNNPGKNYKDLVKEVGDETRKRLDLHKKAVVEEKKPEDKTPKLPTKKGSITVTDKKPNTSPLQNEISEMNKTLGGN